MTHRHGLILTSRLAFIYRQIFYYIGLSSRLKALLEDPVISKQLFLPLPLAVPADQPVRNIYESKAWNAQVERGIGRDPLSESTFGTENGRRNIVLGLNIDGFQPWRNIARSLTPFVCMIYNLPENLRCKAEYMLMVALIPGPNEPKHFNPYLNFLVRELKSLYTEGILIQDPCLDAKAAPVRVRVKLLNIVVDLPAHQHMLLQQGSSAFNGCHKCYIKVSDRS